MHAVYNITGLLLHMHPWMSQKHACLIGRQLHEWTTELDQPEPETYIHTCIASNQTWVLKKWCQTFVSKSDLKSS